MQSGNPVKGRPPEFGWTWRRSGEPCGGADDAERGRGVAARAEELAPKGLSARWESSREAFELALREAAVVPDEAVTVAVSLDGVMVRHAPQGAGRRGRRAIRRQAARRCRSTSGRGWWLTLDRPPDCLVGLTLDDCLVGPGTRDQVCMGRPLCGRLESSALSG